MLWEVSPHVTPPDWDLPGTMQSLAKGSPVLGLFSDVALWLPPVLGKEAMDTLLSHTPSWPFPLCWFHLFHHKYFSDYPSVKDWQYLYSACYSRPLFFWPVSTTISMINNIYYKCMLYYAFYEASTNLWSLKHAFQLKFHLSKKNENYYTATPTNKQTKKILFFNNTLFSADGITRDLFIFLQLLSL